MNKIYKITILFLWIIAVHGFCVAQQTAKPSGSNKTFYLNGKISLDSLTRYVHESSGLRFSFNSTKVKGTKELFFPKGHYAFDELLLHLRKTTSLYYTIYHGYVVFTDNPPRPKKTGKVNKQLQQNQKKNTGDIANAKKKTSPLVSAGKGGKQPSAINKTKSQNTVIKKESNNQAQTKTVGQDKIIVAKKTNVDGTLRKSDTINTAGKQPPLADSNTNSLTTNVNNSGGVDTVSGKTFVKIEEPKTDVPLSNNVATGKDSTGSSVESKLKKNREPSTKPSTPVTQRLRIGNNFLGKLDIGGGLQWNLSLPLQGMENYFTGTNGKTQAYAPLIPGLWINKTWNNKHELILTVHPFQQFYTGNKLLSDSTGQLISGDSIFVRKTTTLVKSSGPYISLQYNFHFSNKWSIGGGLQYHWQTSALTREKTNGLSSGNIISDINSGIKKSDLGRQGIQSSFLATRLELAYHTGKLQPGVALLQPMGSITTTKVGTISPVNLQLFLRWKMIK